ncbi:flagellar hook-length control protein FliK [Kushneria indalinina]|uniref:Flagellar hook-length control protein FliK n=1 Tax=Kushneria indalinina DSM 14324 TaxID=1122140 RepID=A0A3D9DZX2_9GAMM|nr:flagellar hook-length control protein FliK [Kushneria indalinina]REC96327.1 flagellar hook-length control protein FliK [Kushneria indalinina DSM 14324]
MLTPVNAQITSQGSASANTKGSDGDSGFGALLSDTRARRQNDAGTSTANTETRTPASSRQQARTDDTGADHKDTALQTDSGDALADGRKPVQADNARQTLSSALEQLQGNRLEGRGQREEVGQQRSNDRTRPTLSDQKMVDGARQEKLATLADGRQPLEALSVERAGSKLDKPFASRADAKADTLDDKGKRLTESDQTESAASLYGLIDTGFLMQASSAQKAPTGREGALPARGIMLEQGLRGRDAAGLDGASEALKGREQESARSDRLFGEILQQREGPLARLNGAGADAAFNTQTTASTTNDSPLNTLSALTGQTGTSPMAPGAAQAVATATLPAMDSDQWSTALERHTINLSMRGGGEARLNMNPLELGPLSISLKMGEQSAQLHIASHHAQVRAAVEAALPQLREAFSASGIELGQASVSDQGSFQQGGFQQQQERAPGALAGRDGAGAVSGISTEGDSDVISITPLNGRSLNGGIDLFA